MPTILSTRTAAAGAALATVLLATAACGSGSDDTAAASDPTPTSTPTSSSTTGATPTGAATSAAPAPDLDVSIEGDDVTPRGDRVKVDVGQPITIHVTSDRAGELHVHSSPEQELAYTAGETDLTLTIDVPGIVDVEDHVSDTVLAQLEVS